jgi:hypothetical protein
MERDQGNIQNNIVQTQLRHSGAGKQNPRDSENARDSGQETLQSFKSRAEQKRVSHYVNQSTKYLIDESI